MFSVLKNEKKGGGLFLLIVKKETSISTRNGKGVRFRVGFFIPQPTTPPKTQTHPV